MGKGRISCEKARDISILKTLERFGHFPTRKSEKEAWFLSPLRSETQASFKVSLRLNRWYDHGLGKGGNLIDLIIAMENCSFKEALEIIGKDFSSFAFQPQPVRTAEKDEGIRILEKSRIKNPGLVSYLKERKIPLKVARSYCKEIRYGFKEYEFLSIGLENHLGGWELRNKHFKTSNSPKSYTLLENSANRLLVTEGMFDFLSLATLYPKLVTSSDGVVLNSLSFINDIISVMKKYSEVWLYLDNDPAGKRATATLMAESPNARDMSTLYSEHIDLNDKLRLEN